jgi:hypothetical protein
VSALGVVVLTIALLAQWGRKDGNEQLEVLFSVWNLISIFKFVFVQRQVCKSGNNPKVLA